MYDVSPSLVRINARVMDSFDLVKYNVVVVMHTIAKVYIHEDRIGGDDRWDDDSITLVYVLENMIYMVGYCFCLVYIYVCL